jgi:outer membrane protein
MRNRFSVLMFIGAFLASPPIVRSQSAGAAAAAEKIGIINIQAAIANTQEGKKAFNEVEKKYEPRRAELERQQQQINALQDQLQKQTTTLSDEERARLTRELDEKQRIFKRSQEDAQSDFQSDSQDVVRRIGQKMVRTINEYAQQNGFQIIMDPAAIQMPVYFATHDVTEAIIRLYDGANPVAGDAPSGAVGSAPSGGTPKPAATKPGDKPKS